MNFSWFSIVWRGVAAKFLKSCESAVRADVQFAILMWMGVKIVEEYGAIKS